MSKNAYRKLGVAVLAVVVGACRGERAPHVEVSGAWARPTPAGATVGAVYLTLKAATDDALVAVSVEPDVAAEAVLHETVQTDSGASRMQELPALELPAGKDVRIETGGVHIMLEGLAAPLESGDHFELTVEFDRADVQTVDVAVRDQG